MSNGVINRRDLLRAGAGLAVASLPAAVGAGAHSRAMQFTPPDRSLTEPRQLRAAAIAPDA